MRLTLKNFRSHRNATFDIPEKGLVLLSGESGVGKSTIFKAISYALYGNIRKPYSHGANSCQVILETDYIHITRSNRPNRLLIKYEDKTYEDESAQWVIHEVFNMNSKEFSASSYIVQRSYNSVISMTPMEQSKFIETLAFNDDVHKEYKLKFKEKVKEYKKDHIETVIQVEILEREISSKKSSLPKNPPGVDDLSDMNVEDIKSEQNSIKEKLREYEQKLSGLEKDLDRTKITEEKNSSLKENLKTLEIEVNHFTSQRNKLGSVLPPEEIEKIEYSLEKVKEKLHHTESYLKYTTITEKAENFRDEFNHDLQQKIDSLKSKLPPDEEREKLVENIKTREEQRDIYDKERLQIQKEKSERGEATEIVKNIMSEAKKKYPNPMKRVKKEKSLLTVLKREEKSLSDKYEKKQKIYVDATFSDKFLTDHNNYNGGIYKCPCCQQDIFIHIEKGLIRIEKDLIHVDEENKQDTKEDMEDKKEDMEMTEIELKVVREWIEKLQKAIEVLEVKLTKHTVKYDYEKNIKDEKQSDEYQRFEKEISDLEDKIKSNNLPSSIQTLFDESEILKKNFPKKFKVKCDVEKLKEDVKKISSRLEEVWETKSRLSIFSREISTRKKKIENIERSIKGKKFLDSSGIVRDSRKIQEEISDIQKEMVQFSKKISSLQENLTIISESDRYKKALQDISNIENKRQEVLKKSKDLEKKYRGAVGLEEAAKEAEILSMEATIDNINEHAKFYLDKMFQDPIEVYLQSHKTTVKGEFRTQLNTVVSYRGEDFSIDDLSGGEAQRCELSFLLAVNDMIGSPMILLDECLNSLDADINMETIMHLKEVSSDKLIFVSSHEAVKGSFDKVIEL